MKDFNSTRTWGPTPAYPYVKAAKRGDFPELIVIAGPCSVESEPQIAAIVPKLEEQGVSFARGGVFRAGTYPGQVFGLQRRLLQSWSKACRKANLKPIVEVIDLREIDLIDQYADAFQVGARHCQDYALLKELSRSRKPVTLKRNPGMTLDEFLGAAEYLARGSCRPILIERGSATHMNHVRWDLSVSLIAAVKRMTKLPVLVDASHGTGRRDLVIPMTLAGVAAGADGFLVEVHSEPEKSLSDADQALPVFELPLLCCRAQLVREAVQ